MSDQERVIVTRPFLGLLYMQVCAVDDAPEDEILREANLLNPCGTTHGWAEICKDGNKAPVKCEGKPDRTHYMLVC